MSSSILTIAKQNDLFRRAQQPRIYKGKWLMTPGIWSVEDRQYEIMRMVFKFDAFNADNDPHGEHDFGSFEHPVAGKIFWKIDYYNLDYSAGSEDPSDPSKTRRVLTVMLASEY